MVNDADRNITGVLALLSSPPRDDAVALRPWRASDVPGELMGFADPAVQRFSWPHARPFTEQDARSFFNELLAREPPETAVDFALCDPFDSGVVFGGGSLYGFYARHGVVSVGYWLNPAARGRGIATRATRLCARWAFEKLGVSRLELTCAPDNAASVRVAERCGFVREGVLRSNLPWKGGRRDTVVFGLLHGELRP